MRPLSAVRQPAVAVVFGIIAWIVVTGAVLIDLLRISPVPSLTPTVRAISLLPTRMATVTVLPVRLTASATSATSRPATMTEAPMNSPTVAPPTLVITVIPTTSAPLVATQSTASSDCATTPAGWKAYSVQPGDTLFGFVLGSKGQLTVDELMADNCLASKTLLLGQVLYLPPGAADNAPRIDDSPPG